MYYLLFKQLFISNYLNKNLLYIINLNFYISGKLWVERNFVFILQYIALNQFIC